MTATRKSLSRSVGKESVGRHMHEGQGTVITEDDFNQLPEGYAQRHISYKCVM